VKGTKKEAAISKLKLKALADEINDDRNAIVHRGEFRNQKAATKTIETTRRFVEGLVRLRFWSSTSVNCQPAETLDQHFDQRTLKQAHFNYRNQR
jgi:hypothetical protein